MLSGSRADFPLFPLGMVALPGEAVPLHIFEDRYRRMIEHCLQGEGEEFGIIWLAEEELKQVGCACSIEQVLERLPDGRMNILARGTTPFALLERQEQLPYPAGRIEFLPDEVDELDEAAAGSARKLYARLVVEATDREIEASELSQMSAYTMASTVEFEREAKQHLLELRSESARMRMLTTLLASALERMELLERAQVRAMSNGKVRFG